MPSKRPLIIYHQHCMDGFGAAFAAWKRFGDDAEYRPASYTDAPPDVAGRDVTLVDFTWPREILTRLASETRSLLVLDHHKTAEDDLRGLEYAKFDLSKSGAALAWAHWHGEPLPELIRYIQDKDLWTWALPQSEEVSAALQSHPLDFLAWDKLDVEDLKREGQAILRYQRRLVSEIAKLSGRIHLAGHTVPCVNSPVLQSYVGNALAPGHAFVLVWYETADGRRRCSLRAAPPNGIDVSEIAKRFGGGGHPSASGFVLAAGNGNSSFAEDLARAEAELD